MGSKEHQPKSAYSLLQHGRFRMTLPRRMILKYLEESLTYLTADDIFMALYPKNPSISLTTIYRTLNLLEKHDMISKANVGDGRTRFAYVGQDESAHNYHQLICKHCFKIIKSNDFSHKELHCMKECEKRYSERYHFIIENHIIQYYGICEDCQKLMQQESK